MLERISELPAEVLERATYKAEFRAHWDQIEDVFWKLERAQSFNERDFPSWLAFLDGRWDDSMRLVEERRAPLTEKYQRDRDLGIEFRRIRIIEYPFTPYLQWELNAHKVRAEAGEDMRVLDATKLGDLEAGGPLPELTILGRRLMYQVLYDETGTSFGARKFVDQDLIHACRTEMAQLWKQAEDFLPFLEREVLPLPPPVPDRPRPSLPAGAS